MKTMKKTLALVLAAMMCLSLLSMSALAVEPEYKITVTPSGAGASIDGETYKAYKLFDVTYADTTSPADGTNDAFSYTINTASNPFWTNDAVKAILQKYFVFIDTTNSNVKTVAPYTKDNENGTYYQLKDGTFTTDATLDASKYVDKTFKYKPFDANLAYLMTDEINAVEDFVDGLTPANTDSSGVAAGDVAEIKVAEPGYYLVAGTGHPYKEDGTTVDTSKTIFASLALTTTQPTATIKAKIDAPSANKEIDKDASGTITTGDTKDNTAKIGDTVPYVVEGTVPTMNGYTNNYYYYFTDTLSKGLTFNNDVSVVIKKVGTGADDFTVPKDAASSAAGAPGVYYTVEYSYDGNTWTAAPASGALPAKTDAESTTMVRIVLHNFISLKGELTAQQTGDVDNSDEGIYTNPYAGNKVTVTYSATVNDEAVIGNAGNDNSVKLTFSNNPNKEGNGEGTPTDNEKETVTGETPDSNTKTFLTGLKIFKYTEGDNNTENPLAGAKFTLEGDNLGTVKEITKTVFVPDANGTWYLLKDGNYTQKTPTADRTDGDKTIKGTQDQYVAATSETNKKTVDGVGDFLVYNKTTLTVYATENATAHKYEVTSDANGIITFTGGLTAGIYTLTETEAPTGYNKLQAPIYIKVEYVAPTNNDGKHDCEWKISAWEDAACTATKIADLSANATDANLFLEKVLNQTGTELPSTGGIGTKIFYTMGAVLVIGAGVVLVSRKRAAE